MVEPITTLEIGPRLLELGIIPEMCTSFSVHFDSRSCVRVQCEYWMEGEQAKTFAGELAEYMKTVLAK